MLRCYTDAILKRKQVILSEILPGQLLRLYLNFYEYIWDVDLYLNKVFIIIIIIDWLRGNFAYISLPL